MGSESRQRVHKSRTRRYLLGLALIIPIGVYLWLFGFQTLMVLQTRHAFRNIPIANMIPVQLSDETISREEGEKLAYFGSEFDVPWRDIDNEKIQQKAMVRIPFRSGLDLLMSHGSTHDIMDTFIRNSGENPEIFRAAYGDKASQSDYDFLSLALKTTPTSVGIFDSRADVARTLPLLVVKSFIVIGDSGIFNVRSNEFKGFQYGDPKKHPKKIELVLYSSDGLLEFTFSRKDAGPLTITQADINRVISSARRVDAPITAQR